MALYVYLKRLLPLFFVLIFNLWLFKIFTFNIILGVVVVLASIFVFLSIKTGTNSYLYFSTIFIFVLMIFQYKTSSINSLTFLNENEKLEEQERMRDYPRHFYRFANGLKLRVSQEIKHF